MKLEKQNRKKQLQKKSIQNYTIMKTLKQIHNAKYDMIVYHNYFKNTHVRSFLHQTKINVDYSS